MDEGDLAGEVLLIYLELAEKVSHIHQFTHPVTHPSFHPSSIYSASQSAIHLQSFLTMMFLSFLIDCYMTESSSMSDNPGCNFTQNLPLFLFSSTSNSLALLAALTESDRPALIHHISRGQVWHPFCIMQSYGKSNCTDKGRTFPPSAICFFPSDTRHVSAYCLH